MTDREVIRAKIKEMKRAAEENRCETFTALAVSRYDGSIRVCERLLAFIGRLPKGEG